MAVLNHVFVDYQNMTTVDSAIFALERTTITLLLGRANRTLEEKTVRQLMSGAASVEMVRIDKDGKNAVDFALAYYLGRKTVADPMTFFHIVSKDTGFDALVEHLKSRQLKIRRHDGFESLLTLLKSKAPAAAAKKSAVPVQKQSA